MFDLNVLVVPALIGVACYFAAKYLLRKDDEIERRREAAIDLAASLKNYGLTFTADMVKKYAVGDYSGMAHIVGDMVRIMAKGEDAVLKELDAAFRRILEAKMASDEGRAFVTVALQEAEKKLNKDA